MQDGANKAQKMKEYLYLYGIINKKDMKLRLKGLNNSPINKIEYKDIIALTSSYPVLNPMLKEEEAVNHANILKSIAKKTAIVPTSFGTVFKDEEILKIILAKSYQALKQTLALVDCKIELGLKVVKKQFDSMPEGIRQEILGPLDKLSVKSAKGDNFTERLLLNNSFLVEKNKFSKFSNEIARLEKKFGGLRFIYTGPWPPYSFVNINISGS